MTLVVLSNENGAGFSISPLVDAARGLGLQVHPYTLRADFVL